MTGIEFNTLKPGNKVRIVNANMSRHRHKIGSIYEIHNMYANGTNPYFYPKINGKQGTQIIYASEVEAFFISRKEEATELEKKAKAMIKEANEMLDKAKKLKKFKDDEEEMAHLISDCYKKKGDPAAIADLLRKSKIMTK